MSLLLDAWQPTLFAGSPAHLGEADKEITRLALDADSWVDHCPAWLPGDDGPLLETLARTIEWEQPLVTMYDRRVVQPRLTAGIDASRLPDPAFAVLTDARRKLEERYDRVFTAPWCNLYRDGHDSVAWHGDRIGRHRHDSIVVIVSLGAPRPFLLRPVGGGPSRRWRLGRGDLLVMGGACQRDFQHCVPKVARASGPRLSITWRWPGAPLR